MKKTYTNKFKKALAGISSLCIVCAGLSIFPASAKTMVLGDANLDNSLNATDAIYVQKHILGFTDINLDEAALKLADANQDANVNISDVVWIRKAIIHQTYPTIEIEDTQEPAVTGEYTITLSSAGIATNAPETVATITDNVLTVISPAVFIVTGECSDAQIVVNVDKTAYPAGVVELSLEGMSLSCSNNSPIYVASIDDECVITAKKDTVNTISDSSTAYTNADEDSGAIYSKDDLKFKGKGTLTVNGNYTDGIVGKDSVKIFNSTLNVNAVDDGIRGKDSVKIGDADDIGTDGAFENLFVTVNTTSGDGIKATNTEDTTSGKVIVNGGTVNATVFSDGIQAESSLTVNGGDITIYSYQGSTYTSGQQASDGNGNKMPTDLSAKGLKAASGDITINGGTMNIDTSDDCIHASNGIYLYGGEMTLASADDAIHGDASLTVGNAGGALDDFSVYVTRCYEGLEGAVITQNAGTVIVNSTDDGYNAGGGADGSGTTSPGGWGQGSTATGTYSLTINGGFALVNATDGDHDGFDSNGNLTIAGGYVVSNGNEPFDCGDGATLSFTGGVYVKDTGSGGMGGMGGMGGSTSMTQTVSASGSASAGTMITIADTSNNVIVSFLASKNVSTVVAGCTGYSSAVVYTGGTISNATYLPAGAQSCTVTGTISGGTQLSGSSTTNPWG